MHLKRHPSSVEMLRRVNSCLGKAYIDKWQPELLSDYLRLFLDPRDAWLLCRKRLSGSFQRMAYVDL